MLLRFWLIAAMVCSGTSLFSQAGTYWSHYLIQQELESAVITQKVRSHLSVRPTLLRDLPEGFFDRSDSALFLQQMSRQFWQKPGEGTNNIAVLPLIQAGAGLGNEEAFMYTARAGFAANVNLGRKLALYADVLGGVERVPGYVGQFADSLGILPTLGKYGTTDNGLTNVFPSARLSYLPSKYFALELGYGSNFIGSGYRSVFLSDLAYRHPYLKIETDVWNVKYVNIFSVLRDIRPEVPREGGYRQKFSSTHYLSWAITEWLNMGLFESIVWQNRDTSLQRGYDPHYLNPVIFYRPVEFAIGSPDNVLLGLDVAVKINRQFQAYGQFVIDEFLLREFRSGEGWWANKWGMQLGLKWFEMLNKPGLYGQVEFNLARPFTYTHGSVLQNFAHYNQPLAHMLGTNFYEILGRVYREKRTVFVEARFMYALYGRDTGDENLGGNIFRSYANPARQYGNTIAQGLQSNLYYGEFSAGKILNKSMNLRLAAQLTLRHIATDGRDPLTEYIVGLSLSSALYNAYRDF